MTMLFLRIAESTSSNWVGGPFGKSRSSVLPAPTNNGWIQSRSSSSRPCSMREGRDDAEAVLDDVLARLGLELTYTLGYVARDHGRVRPVRVFQGGRDDVLGHGVDAVGVGVAGAGLPHRREALIRSAPHQDCVAGEQQVGLDLPAPLVWGSVDRRPE